MAKKITGADRGITNRLEPLPARKPIEDKKHKLDSRQNRKKQTKKEVEDSVGNH